MPPAGSRASYDVLFDPFFDVLVPLPVAEPVVLPVCDAVFVPEPEPLLLLPPVVAAAESVPVFEAVSAAVVFSLLDAEAVSDLESVVLAAAEEAGLRLAGVFLFERDRRRSGRADLLTFAGIVVVILADIEPVLALEQVLDAHDGLHVVDIGGPWPSSRKG